MAASRRPKKRDHILQAIRLLLEEGRYRETLHAHHRKHQRKILLTEILHVLRHGFHEKKHDKFDEAFYAWNYAIRGRTVDEKTLRVIISFDEDEQLLIITAFYLEK